MHRCRPVTAKLVKPIVGFEKQAPKNRVTLPIGCVVEFHHNSSKIGLVVVQCEGKHYSVYLQDLMDACSVDDLGRSAWP